MLLSKCFCRYSLKSWFNNSACNKKFLKEYRGTCDLLTTEWQTPCAKRVLRSVSWSLLIGVIFSVDITIRPRKLTTQSLNVISMSVIGVTSRWPAMLEIININRPVAIFINHPLAFASWFIFMAYKYPIRFHFHQGNALGVFPSLYGYLLKHVTM